MRRSIAGPVIVIAIGVIFFANNFIPDLFSWRALFQYWPFLLIGLGVIRLLEVLIDAGRARPLPPSRFNAGGIVFVVILVALVYNISKNARNHIHGPHFSGMPPVALFGGSFDFDVKGSQPVTAGDARLVIEGLHGSVSVTGEDTSEVSFTGHKTIHSFTQHTADQANRMTQIEVVHDGNDIVIRSKGTPERHDMSLSYDIEVKVPKRLNVLAQGSPGDVSVESIDGNVDISGGNGNVHLTTIGGDVRVETTRRKDLVRAVGIKGALEVRGTGTDLQVEDVVGQVTIQGNYFGTLDFRNLAKPLHFESEQTDLRVEKLPGSISMDLGEFRADNITGALRLRCQSRDVHVSNFTSELEINVDRGDIELDPQHSPLAKMDVHLRAGDVDLTVPDKAPFSLHGSTSQGDVDNEFGDGIISSSEGRAASLQSKSTSGPAINLTTDRGNITLKKS